MVNIVGLIPNLRANKAKDDQLSNMYNVHVDVWGVNA